MAMNFRVHSFIECCSTTSGNKLLKAAKCVLLCSLDNCLTFQRRATEQQAALMCLLSGKHGMFHVLGVQSNHILSNHCFLELATFRFIISQMLVLKTSVHGSKHPSYILKAPDSCKQHQS